MSDLPRAWDGFLSHVDLRHGEPWRRLEPLHASSPSAAPGAGTPPEAPGAGTPKCRESSNAPPEIAPAALDEGDRPAEIAQTKPPYPVLQVII